MLHHFMMLIYNVLQRSVKIITIIIIIIVIINMFKVV